MQPYRRRKNANSKKDNWDKVYPRLAGAGSFMAAPNPRDPADELLRAMLQRTRE